MGQYIRYTMLGIALDVDPVDLPDDVWTNSANMVAQPGQMQRALGYIETLPAPLFPPYYLQFSPQLPFVVRVTSVRNAREKPI